MQASDVRFIEVEFPKDGPGGREIAFEVENGVVTKVWTEGYDYALGTQVLEYWVNTVGEERILDEAISKYAFERSQEPEYEEAL